MYALVNRHNPVTVAEDIDTLLKVYEESKIQVVDKYNLYYEIYEYNEDNDEFVPTGEYIMKAIMR